jgi:hypothetical protein
MKLKTVMIGDGHCRTSAGYTSHKSLLARCPFLVADADGEDWCVAAQDYVTGDRHARCVYRGESIPIQIPEEEYL